MDERAMSFALREKSPWSDDRREIR